MSVTSGFFNSINNDRTYDARQVSELFDGVIGDGVFMHVGEGLQVYPTNTPNTVAVGTGRCWFNHVWVKNWPSRLLITLPEPDEVYQRIDAIVVEIQHEKTKRKGHITYVKGIAKSSPEHPTLKKEGDNGTSQYPLAYIFREPYKIAITSSDIISRIGFSDCPWVVAPAGVVSLDQYWSNWESQWGNWFNDFKDDSDETFENFMTQKDTSYTQFENSILNEWQEVKSELEAQTSIAVNTSQEAIDGTLASQLQKQIDDLEFTNNMTPFAGMQISNTADTPDFWYSMNSSYGMIVYSPTVGSDELEGGLIENFVSPYSYKYNDDSEPSPNEKDGFFISQIMRSTSPEGLYVRTGYYRNSRYDSTTSVELETGWDYADNGNNGWREVSDDKVSKSGDVMSGSLEVKSNDGEYLSISATRQISSSQSNSALLGVTTNGYARVQINNNLENTIENYIDLRPNDTALAKPLNVASGGTGANNAANARENLSAMGAVFKSNYWGLMTPDGTDNTWIRAPQSGIIPFAQNGTCNLGSGGGWYFNAVYANNIYPLKSTSAMSDYVVSSGAGNYSGTNCTWFKFNGGTAIISYSKAYTNTGNPTHVYANLPFNITSYHTVANSCWVGGSPASRVGYTYMNSNSTVEMYVYDGGTNQNAVAYGVVMGKWK